MDGILGLAFPSMSNTNSKNFVQNAKDQGKIEQAIFSFALNKASSELYIGGDNPAKYTGNFTCAPVTEQRFWMVEGSVEPSGAKVPTQRYSGKMIVDSGTTILVGGPTSVAIFYAGIPGAEPCTNKADCGTASGFYTVPCDKVPSLTATFNGCGITIPPESFISKSSSLRFIEVVLIARKCSGKTIQ